MTGAQGVNEKPMLTASVVICAYTEDRWDLLVLSVESVLRQDRKPIEVIVCVDHNDALRVRAAP